MTPPFLPYGRQTLDDDDVAAVAKALRGDFITQGPTIDRFERELAAHVGARHAVAFSSGTAALHGAAAAADLGPGDDVITTPLSFAASSNCVMYRGARPRFVDISPDTWNLDCRAAAEAVRQDTKAVIAVSFAGLPVDLSPLDAVRDRVTVIEDGCHALGGHRDGRPVGGPGGADMTVFSFHPVKAMTMGEGGVVTTEDDEFARRLRTFRTHGIAREGIEVPADAGAWYYDMQELGFNYRITDFQCALGISQLRRLDPWIDRRNAIASRYRELLHHEPRVALSPEAPAGSRHGYHLFVIRVLRGMEQRKRVFAELRGAGIGVQVHYIPIYRFTYYRDVLGFPQDECPETEGYYSGAISLPVFPGMEDGDVDRVVTEVRRVLR